MSIEYNGKHYDNFEDYPGNEQLKTLLGGPPKSYRKPLESSTDIGIKDLQGKLDYSEINLLLLDLMAERMMKNKEKYPKGNGKKSIPTEDLAWAAFRHLRKILQPIPNDPESMKDHIAAVACNMSLIIDQLERKP